jgi:hypothetical protein
MSTAAAITWTPQDSTSALNPFFENAPFALAQCQLSGNIIALNSTLERHPIWKMAGSYFYASPCLIAA